MYTGTPIVSATSGTVEDVKTNIKDDNNRTSTNRFGNHVIIEMSDGTRIIYAHMQNVPLPVKKGDTVRPGDYIGNVGSSGDSTGPHVHVEVQLGPDYNRANNPNPYDYFPK